MEVVNRIIMFLEKAWIHFFSMEMGKIVMQTVFSSLGFWEKSSNILGRSFNLCYQYTYILRIPVIISYSLVPIIRTQFINTLCPIYQSNVALSFKRVVSLIYTIYMRNIVLIFIVVITMFRPSNLYQVYVDLSNL